MHDLNLDYKYLIRSSIAGALAWSALIAVSLYWNYSNEHQQMVDLASIEARSHFNKDKAFRFWGASHGGVYVPASEHTPPNPRLSHIPERDITTPSGKKLTLMNPAYMLRQMMQNYGDLYGVRGKITTFPDKLFYQGNMPDAWELAALQSFQKGGKEVKEIAEIDGVPYMRLIRPLFAQQGCLKCHGFQGYKVGDLRGAVGVSVPMAPYLKSAQSILKSFYISHGLLWLVGLFALLYLFEHAKTRIRERFESESEVRSSEASLNEAQRIAHVGSWELDLINDKLIWSDEVFRIFEIDKEKQLPSYDAFLDAVHSDDRDKVNHAYTSSIETREPYSIVHRLQFPDGRIKHVHEHSETYYDNNGLPLRSIGTVQDITKQTETEKTLKENEERFALAMRGANDGLWDWNLETDEVYYSPRWQSMLGYEEGELEATLDTWATLVHPDDKDGVLERVQDYLESRANSFEVEMRMQHKDGHEVAILSRAFLVRRESDGKPVRLVGTHVDITEAKLAKLALQDAKEAAESASQSKSRFLAMMSHEIRTPLNGVLGLTELVLDSNLSEEQREYLQTVHASGEILLIILNDILDFSKMEAGQFELSVAPFSPNELIEHVIKLYAQNAHNKGVDLISDAIPDLDCHLIGDSDRLQQVLMNLISNAVKFTAEGEVSLRVSVLAEDDDKMSLRFAAHDSGIGISKEDQHKLFADFSQVDASHVRQYGGTGLGLSIALKLVNLMDSEIHVESEEGKGSTFFFDVEMKKGEKLPDAAMFHQQDFSKWKGLIVGNDGHQRTMLGDLLTGWGMRVNAENSMPAALDALMNAVEEDAYHVVIIDKTASETNALELVRSIRQEEKLSGLKIIIQCAYDEVRSNCKNEDEGVNACLRKPLYQSTLYKQILRVMGSMQDGSSVELAQETFATARAERILLAEDVIVNQQVACGMLKKLGFGHVDIANNGVEAVEMFAKESYALVLMDIQMPEMDGYTAAQKIRFIEHEQKHETRTPIVALTAHVFAEDRKQSLAAGMDDLLAKPLTGKKLAEAVNVWIPAGDALAAGQMQAGDDEGTVRFATLDGDVLRGLHTDIGGGIGMIMDMYIDGLPGQIENICQAIYNKDAEFLRSSAHRLKGSSYNLGATALGELCAMLESQAEDMGAMAVDQLIQSLNNEKESLLQAFAEPWLEEIR